MIKEAKQRLRAQIRTEFTKYTDQDLSKRSQQICEQIFSYVKESTPQNIGVYMPLKDEVNLEYLIEKLKHLPEIKLAIPHLDNNKIFFQAYEPDSTLEKNQLGILQQAKENSIVTPDLIIVPGLAFSKSGNRLGRGLGCFDRYLKEFNGQSIGACFEFQIFPAEQIPVELHDQTVNQVFYA